MRLAIIGIVTVAAGLAADAQAASAQTESFYNRRYCAWSNISRGSLNCAYDTMEQCMRAPFEPSRVCGQNPFWHGGREGTTAKALDDATIRIAQRIYVTAFLVKLNRCKCHGARVQHGRRVIIRS